MVLASVGPGSRSRSGVGLRGRPVDVDVDAGVGGGISSGELDGRAGHAVAVSGDLDLGAANVELGATDRTGAVQAEVLRAEKVLAGRRAGGEGEGEVLGSLAAGVVVGPREASGGADAAGGQGVDLEPVAVTEVVLGRDAGGGLAQVDGLGTGVAEVRVDVEAELVTGGNSVGAGGGTDGGVVATLVADDVGGADALDGRVGVGRTADVLVWVGAHAVDDQRLEVVVSENAGREDGSNSRKGSEGTHLEMDQSSKPDRY